MMKKDKDELRDFNERTSLGCCLSGFFFRESKHKLKSRSFNKRDLKNKDLKKKDLKKDDLTNNDLNKKDLKKDDLCIKDSSLEKTEKLETLKLGLDYPVEPARPPLPPPYYPTVVPILEFDAPKSKENYPIKGFNSSTIHNNDCDKSYRIGKLLGKGGFAKCFELTDEDNDKVYAGKIISKICLTKVKQKEKILKEIELHSSLRHRNVVRFYTSFEDSSNVYIILEHCSRKSLLHVLKSRKSLTECETRYFLKQLIDGTIYIHSQHIIHRDLKLGNMLLNEKMMVKIADFGLATKVEHPGEKKMTVCGTPNYIAPEVLQKKGHSFEADIWAIGCIMYALLVGQPPFETHSLKETYLRITKNLFKVPSFVSTSSKELITQLLKALPNQRPSLSEITKKAFFTLSYTPKHLPTSCCDTQPSFIDFKTKKIVKTEEYQRITTGIFVESSNNNNNNNNNNKKNKNKNNNNNKPDDYSNVQRKVSTVRTKTKVIYASKAPVVSKKKVRLSALSQQSDSEPASFIFKYGKATTFHLYEALNYCTNNIPSSETKNFCPRPITHFQPTWITKWVDYSNKYGFGFQLSDQNVGILFNDTTRMVISTDKRTLAYNDLSNQTLIYPINTTPSSLRKKATLLMYFSQYMEEHLIHGAERGKGEEEECKRSSVCGRVFVRKWFRTDAAIVMQLSNGTLQVNFLSDHTKLIISYQDQEYIVTYIDHRRKSISYRLISICKYGCEKDVLERLKFAKKMVENIINFSGETV